jgi:hypothetical protein
MGASQRRYVQPGATAASTISISRQRGLDDIFRPKLWLTRHRQPRVVRARASSAAPAPRDFYFVDACRAHVERRGK